MIKGSSVRVADHPIADLFLDRWSPRAMSGESIERESLMRLFEAARWAPSSYNNQPWRFLYARRGSEHWPRFFDLLAEGNQAWAKHAAALVLIVSKTTFDFNGKPSITHSFDAGAAWENLALQGAVQGLVIHAMQGFDYDRARAELKVPEEFAIEAMVVIGRPAPKDTLPEKLQQRESPSTRRSLGEIVCEGRFSFLPPT
jgi:nitroreductase